MTEAAAEGGITLYGDELLDTSGAAFLQAMELFTVGWSEEEIEATARACHVTSTEILAWKEERAAKTAEERMRLEVATAVLAAGAERAILNRGRVLTDAIRDATPEQLLQFIDYYEAETDRLYREAAALADKLDDPSKCFEYLQVRHKFERLAGFLWEARTQSGVWDVNHPRQEAS